MPEMQMHVMDADEQAAQHAVVLAANEVKERARVAAANRAAGFAEPKAGDRLYVSAGRGTKQRSRAGICFNDQEPTEVLVVEECDEKPPGAVTISGAELILADRALNVTARNATEAESAGLRKQLADRDSEIAKLKAEHARQLREARMSAKDNGDGSPSRLLAARKAKAGQGDPGFGGTE